MPLLMNWIQPSDELLWPDLTMEERAEKRAEVDEYNRVLHINMKEPNYIERYNDGGANSDEFGEYPFHDWINYEQANLKSQSLVAEIETVGHSLIILRHKIRLYNEIEPVEFNTVFYYLKIPKTGLTYYSLFKQMHDQYESSDYFDKYHDIYDENEGDENSEENIIAVLHDERESIIGFKKTSAIQYDIVCK
jgi:hypothetical protein